MLKGWIWSSVGLDLFLCVYHQLPVHLCVKRSLLYLAALECLSLFVTAGLIWPQFLNLFTINNCLGLFLSDLLDQSCRIWIKCCRIQIPDKSFGVEIKWNLNWSWLNYLINVTTWIFSWCHQSLLFSGRSTTTTCPLFTIQPIPNGQNHVPLYFVLLYISFIKIKHHIMEVQWVANTISW